MLTANKNLFDTACSLLARRLGEIDFISETAQPGMRSILQTTKRSAQATRYWEDSYKIIYDAYGQLQNMNY